MLATGATILTCRTAAAQSDKPPIASDKPPIAEKPVEASAKQKQEKKDLTAWGKEVGGLQLGLALVPVDKIAYRPREEINFEIRVRNISKTPITISYGLPESAPEITNAKGEKLTFRTLTMPPLLGIYVVPTEKALKPGETVVLFKREVAVEEFLDGKPDPKTIVDKPTIRVQAGKYKIAFSESVQSKLMLSTGVVEFELDEAKQNAKPIFRMRVHIEKVTADSRSINAFCLLLGEIDGVTKPLRFEHLSVSENAKLEHNGKDLKFADLKPETEVLLILEAASEVALIAVGIETGKTNLSQGVKQKPFRMRVHVEKVNADSRTITASCLILGLIDNVWKPLRFEHLSVSENAKIKINGKDLKLTDLKPATDVFLELEAASELDLKAVGIETFAKANPGVDAGQLGDGNKKGAKEPISKEPISKEPILATLTLSDAIKEANEKASKDAIGKDETPVTEQEVIAGIRALQRPKDVAVTDKLFDAFKRITETRQLPPGAAIEAAGGLWDPGADFDYDVWWVRIVMPKEGGGTYSFPVRQRIIRSRTLQEELVRIEKERTDPPTVDGGRLQGRIDDLKARIAKMKAK